VGTHGAVCGGGPETNQVRKSCWSPSCQLAVFTSAGLAQSDASPSNCGYWNTEVDPAVAGSTPLGTCSARTGAPGRPAISAAAGRSAAVTAGR